MPLIVYVITGLFFLTSLGMSLVCLAMARSSQQVLIKIMSYQQSRIQDLTNLVVAKDLTTFQALQHTKQSVPTDSESYGILNVAQRIPDTGAMDDASVARRMATQYAEEGVDPALAYDVESFSEEFGGTFL